MENDIFWSEIGSGFGEPGGTPLPRIPRSNPHPPGTSVIILSRLQPGIGRQHGVVAQHNIAVKHGPTDQKPRLAVGIPACEGTQNRGTPNISFFVV